jgi:hypothetical protein
MYFSQTPHAGPVPGVEPLKILNHGAEQQEFQSKKH